MNLEQLVSLYKDDQRIRELTDAYSGWLQDQENTPLLRAHLTGMLGSVESFVAAGLIQQTRTDQLFILTDKEEAAYFHNGLQGLLPNYEPLFLPDSFKRTGRFDELDNNNVMLRTEVTNKIIHAGEKQNILVTYSEALFEKTVQEKMLEQKTIRVKMGDELDIDHLMDQLVEARFERTDFVYEPGHFSIRGGIIDIFSFGNEFPYRVELFGNEVESIRTFDPASQLSTRKIAEVSIVPNLQTNFESGEKTSLLKILSPETLVWCKDINFTLEILHENFQRASKQAEDSDGEWNLESMFETPANILNGLHQFNIIESGTKPYLSPDLSVHINTHNQPSFNKNFDLLIKDLRKNQNQELRNFIFTDNPRQIERFHNIFDDLDANVEFSPIYSAIHRGFIDKHHKIACYTDHQIFERFHKYNVKKGFAKSEAMMLKALKELKPGDFVTHIDHGVGKFSGLEKIEVNGHVQETVRLIYRDNDLLYVGINSLHKISKYSGKEGTQPRVNKLGSDVWASVKRKAKKQIKDIAKELIALYAKRKAQEGFAFDPDSYLQTELEASFIYEDTPDQEKATADFKKDMEAGFPMDRLICGDVGFGKTEIAVRAAFKAVADSKQVAILVPTTILAMQHYETFRARLRDFPANVEYVNRFKSTKEKKETLQRVKEGRTDILIGTHALLGKAVEFKDLGLLVIDEEQKFGVSAKEKLRAMKVNVDTLTLTATPIPRTLQFSLMGARDLSIINTPPPNRQPIQTELHTFNDNIIREAITYEVYRGGQVFFVHNRVKDLVDVCAMLKRLCPDVDFGMAHGQLEGKELEKMMMKFINREYDVLVSTNIVESGLDIPNANTIIINNAHWFGLSDLHQLRGRVGRSNKKAFCYLFSPPLSALPSDSRKRLRTIEEFSELGSGFNIAMRDLDIRGAGNLLGAEQSGFISDIGFDMYHKILDEAILELKETEFKDLYKQELENKKTFVRECQIDTDIEMLIPDKYVANINERLSLYTELDNLDDETGLEGFRKRLLDRFGVLPSQVHELFFAIRLRWEAKRLGFERIVFKNNVLKGYFISNQESQFYQTAIFTHILNYIQGHHGQFQMKQTDRYLILILKNVHSMKQAVEQLKKILEAVEV